VALARAARKHALAAQILEEQQPHRLRQDKGIESPMVGGARSVRRPGRQTRHVRNPNGARQEPVPVRRWWSGHIRMRCARRLDALRNQCNPYGGLRSR
jgi:hypothetical protein